MSSQQVREVTLGHPQLSWWGSKSRIFHGDLIKAKDLKCIMYVMFFKITFEK